MAHLSKTVTQRSHGSDYRHRASGAAMLREQLSRSLDEGPGDTNETSLFEDIAIQDQYTVNANFEEWIKMTTDNKINAANSWNLGLIDYFHKMDVLKGSDNSISFQKASATLDGCVKIYTSRVDSVATETGRLLSGLSAKRSQDHDGDGDEEEDEDDDDEDCADEKTKKLKPKKNTGSGNQDSTLASGTSIEMRKLEVELAIDPLFKKTLAEFDEGGSKSLLLNTLHMDRELRVVFDAGAASSTDVEKDKSLAVILEDAEDTDMDGDGDHIEITGIGDDQIDIASLKSIIYDSAEDLSQATLCPSYGHLTTVLSDTEKAKNILRALNEHNETVLFESNADAENDLATTEPDYNAYTDLGFGGDDSFGEMDNGAAAVIMQDEEDNMAVEHSTALVRSELLYGVMDHDLMAYFDNTIKPTWAGPEHWRVKNLKRNKESRRMTDATGFEGPGPDVKRRRKEAATVNFLDDEDLTILEKDIFKKGRTNNTLSEPEKKAQEATKNLIPDVQVFSSEQLTRLFGKPEVRLNFFRKEEAKPETVEILDGVNPHLDATFWADNYENQASEPIKVEEGDNPFFDDHYDGVEDDDGYDDSPDNAGAINNQNQFASNRLNNRDSKGLEFAKAAKHINVKELKDNIWKVLEREIPREKREETEPVKSVDTKQFSQIVKDTTRMYKPNEKKDLSTSFYFICLLHLANEHSLVIENNESLTDLKISGLADAT